MSNQLHTKQRSFSVKSALVSASLLMGLALASSPAQAASACKGLDDKACGASSSCLWVNGYQRKDGRNVSSFCRAKATARTSAKSTKPIAKSKTSSAAN